MGAAGAMPGGSGASKLRRRGWRCDRSEFFAGACRDARADVWNSGDSELLDVDGLAAGATTDVYTQLIQEQANILVAENAMKWRALRPSPTSFDLRAG